MKKKLAIGLMSGTSGDGVSLALVSFADRSFESLAYQTYPYPEPIARKIVGPGSLSLAEISSLNFKLGAVFADAVLRFLRENKIRPDAVAAIGSHGQTLHHDPKGLPPSTFQIGEPGFMAEKTGIPVVSDFRPRDVVLGGEGAPLIPFFDRYFFGQGPARVLQNIGGIANASVVGKGVRKTVAFDNGPGNCFIDWAVQTHTRGKCRYDDKGDWARKGRVLMDAVQKMAGHPYFNRRPPKSAGRELFNPAFLPAALKAKLKKSPFDVIHTLTFFTAYAIAESYKKFLPQYSLKDAVISGGGAFNTTLMKHLQSLIYPLPLNSIGRLGLHAQAKEPAAFAFFALRALEGKINHEPEGTGASKAAVLGKITPGKNFKGLR